MKKAIFTLLMLVTLQASADYVYLGAWSKHFDYVKATNETHNLVAYERNNWLVGYYNNSYDDDTVMAGYKFKRQLGENWQASVAVGVSYGYRACMEKSDGLEDKRVCPAFFPELTYTKYRLQPSFIMMGDGVAVALRFKL